MRTWGSLVLLLLPAPACGRPASVVTSSSTGAHAASASGAPQPVATPPTTVTRDASVASVASDALDASDASHAGSAPCANAGTSVASAARSMREGAETEIEGWVASVYFCNPYCPKGAQCSPCDSPHVTLADHPVATAADRGTFRVELAPSCPGPSVGACAKFRVRFSDCSDQPQRWCRTTTLCPVPPPTNP